MLKTCADSSQSPEKETREVMLRRVMQLFNKVRNNGCESVVQLLMRQSEKRGGWGGKNEYRVNSMGQWVDGKNVAVEWKVGDSGRSVMKREEVGFAAIFADKGIEGVMKEIERAAEVKKSR